MATNRTDGVSRPNASPSCWSTRAPSRRAWSPRSDGASHNRADRRDRDAFVDEVLAAIGIPILHVRWQRSYGTRALAEQIAHGLGIAAPAPALALHGAASVSDSPPAPSPPSVPTLVPAIASTIAPAPIAAAGRACGQCQAELREGAKFCALWSGV